MLGPTATMAGDSNQAEGTTLHGLLRKQLERVSGDLDSVPDSWRPLIELVNAAYEQADVDRGILERSLELSSGELLQANSEMRAVLSAFPDIFFWLRADGTIVNVQSSDPADLVLPVERLLGRRIQDLPDRHTASTFDQALGQLRSTGELVGIEYPLTIRGQELSYEARLLPLMNKQVLAIVRNITERKHAEQALGEEKERLSVTLSSIADGVVTTDMTGRVTLLNEVGERLTGWDADDARGEQLSVVFPVVDPVTNNPLPAPIDSVLRGEPSMIPLAQLLPAQSDEVSRVEYLAAPMYDECREIIGAVVVFRDISTRERMEQDRVRASKLDSIGLLAGGIAHDFNNILTAILANVSLAQLQLPPKHDPELGRLLKDTEVAVFRATELTRQLLTFSRGGAPVKAIASVADLLRESGTFALRGSSSRCELHIDPQLAAVDIDSGQISQVINNLIINGDQAMPGGGTVAISATNDVAPVSTDMQVGVAVVHISVSDHGIGIPHEYQQRIFDPYFTTKQKGSGLGLATSYAIIKNHGGAIWVESEVGRGTSFHILLPASSIAPAHVDDADPAPIHQGRGRVLVMDDEPAIRRVAESMLHRLGYRPVMAVNGDEAIGLLQAAAERGEEFVAMIVDLTIPGGLGGVEMLARLSELGIAIPAIASTGYSNDPVMAGFRDYGFEAILAKPYNLSQLSVVLARVTVPD